MHVEEDTAAGYTGYVDGTHRWKLPGIICPACKAIWSSGSKAYPSAALTPVASLADFEQARPEPVDEYERLCELVRPLLPPGAMLEPGTGLVIICTDRLVDACKRLGLDGVVCQPLHDKKVAPSV
ncbi:MAG TPA: double-CXXCG motif protein [Archangium sp.]|nr:double-CXXCG motif protein [Archangium sp.]